MASVQIKKLTNGNVYIDGNNYLGAAKEIDLPKVVQVMAEYSGLGLAGKIELPSGIEKMESKITWNSFFPEVFKKIGDPSAAMEMQIRGNLEDWSSGGRGNQQPYVCYMTATQKELNFGSFKQHENVEHETNYSVYYVKLEVNGESIIEFDAMANIYKVNGTDIMETYRTNIGG